MTEKEWRIRAAEQQQSFHSLLKLRKWTKKNGEDLNLKENLAYVCDFFFTDICMALYGRLYWECNEEEQKSIKVVHDFIDEVIREGDILTVVKFSYTYISTWNKIHDGVVPLLRIKIDGEIWFIDTKGVYLSWEEYLEINKLSDDLYICYPKDGFYDTKSEFVEVKYARCGSLRNPKKVIEEAGSLQPVPSVRFFPLYEPFFDVGFEVDSNDILITIKRIQDDEKPYTDAHSLAMWFKMLIPIYGTETTEEPETTKLRIEKEKAQKAMELFELFYESPYSVHGFFVVVYLMKMLATRRINSSNTDEECLKSAGVLKYILNVSVTYDRIEDFIVTLFENYSFSNLFKFTYRQKAYEKEVTVHSQVGLPNILNLIAQEKKYSGINEMAKELIIDLNEIVQKEYREGINASSIGVLVSKAVSRRCNGLTWKSEMCKRRDVLLSSVSTKFAMKMEETINAEYTNAEMDALLNCFQKIDVLIEKKSCRSVIKTGFFQFCVKFSGRYSRPVRYGGVGREAVFRFLTGKFTSYLSAFLAQNAAKANTKLIENVCKEFVEKVDDLLTTPQLIAECSKMNQIFVKSDAFVYLFNYGGIRVSGIKTTVLTETYRSRFASIRAKIPEFSSYFKNASYLEIVRYYLDDIDELPQNPNRFEDECYSMHSKNEKFVLTVPLKPNKRDTLSTFDTLGIVGIVLMFKACPPTKKQTDIWSYLKSFIPF